MVWGDRGMPARWMRPAALAYVLLKGVFFSVSQNLVVVEVNWPHIMSLCSYGGTWNRCFGRPFGKCRILVKITSTSGKFNKVHRQ